MKFEKISIRNFRNFENIEIGISNKNIFFGLNDIGKTNFLYAMRYVFDKDIRKNGFLDSDFHKKNVEIPIEITVTVDISDTDDSDSQKLRAQLKGAILSQHTKVFIKLVAKYNVQELVAMPILYWGGSLDRLYEIKQRGYLFVTTHSPFVLYDMDGVSLIRIFHGPSIDSASYFYQVPANFEKNRKMLNRYLAEAIFANKVLLVEGPSELLLFERVLSTINPFYEVDGIYILSVEGVGFSQYCKILNALKIKWIVKTDNDLRRPRGKSDYVAYGFQRCNKIIGEETLPIQSYPDDSIANKRTLYAENKEALDDIRANCGIFLSVVDLENDLDEVLHDNLCEYLDTSDPVAYLQKAKHFHMADLVEAITDADCRTIFGHYNFACLEEITK